MPEIMEGFNETNDLYQEMLMSAQRMEDKKLVRLIKQRLECIEASPTGAARKCKVIMFPRRLAIGA